MFSEIVVSKYNIYRIYYLIGIQFATLFYLYILFSILLLNEKIYKHRCISIIIISIFYLIITICNYINLKKEDKITEFKIGSFSLFLITIFIIQGMNALLFVLIKVHFNNYSTDPYLFMFYLGLTGLLIFIPFEIIYYFCFDDDSEILGIGIISQIRLYLKEYLKNFIYFFLDFFLNTICFYSEILIIYHFTPCHLTISFIIFSVIIRCTDWKSNNNNEEILYKILLIILNIIITVFSLIYNEIIIIKLCSLEKDTMKYISIRQKNEYDNLDQFYNDDEDEELNSNDGDITPTIECENVINSE